MIYGPVPAPDVTRAKKKRRLVKARILYDFTFFIFPPSSKTSTSSSTDLRFFLFKRLFLEFSTNFFFLILTKHYRVITFF